MLSPIVQAYTAFKNLWSSIFDKVYQVGRSPLPSFSSPGDAGGYLIRNAKYTGDPGNGVVDFDTRPEVLQFAMEQGLISGRDRAFTGLFIDCDDYASWAYAVCRNIPGCNVQIYTLVDLGLTGTHVICVGTWRGLYFAIDTNGYRTLPDLKVTTLCNVWSEIYKSRGYRYIEADPIPYAFGA